MGGGKPLADERKSLADGPLCNVFVPLLLCRKKSTVMCLRRDLAEPLHKQAVWLHHKNSRHPAINVSLPQVLFTDV